mgnify:CR=1 FL=1
MFYKVFLVAFLLTNFLINSFGQPNVALVLENEGMAGLEELVQQKKSYKFLSYFNYNEFI